METILEEYEGHLLDIGKILHFVNQGLYKLRGHPFLRSGTQHYSEDWEVRMAVQMIGMVDTPVMRAVEVTDSAVASVQGLFKGMDKYFVKDSRELKKGCKKEIVAEIKEVANILNDAIVTLNTIREELQEATGHIWALGRSRRSLVLSSGQKRVVHVVSGSVAPRPSFPVNNCIL